ncbi:hypothetical protein [Kribbella speibonae]|uniref:DUF3558 domain-containing protein n=1 Tax=Kribbella speibonae TaxID=1572660 RepID=A0A4V2M3F2_9ACTN|nr:hypothetical protein [Kribbella speibonae]TCC31792.1 hypothetical protein E0H92_35245 [Kribbella speibonae]
MILRARWISAAGCLVLVLAGCTTRTADPTRHPFPGRPRRHRRPRRSADTVSRRGCHGVRARYYVRTLPVGDEICTERLLQYRTDQYVVSIRLDAFDNPEATFLAFAQQTRDRLAAQLKG